MAESLLERCTRAWAELDDVSRRLGRTSAQDRQDEALDRVHELERKIIAAPASTLEAIAIKAQLLRTWSASNKWDEGDEADWDDKVIRTVLDQVIEAAGMGSPAAALGLIATRARAGSGPRLPNHGGREVSEKRISNVLPFRMRRPPKPPSGSPLQEAHFKMMGWGVQMFRQGRMPKDVQKAFFMIYRDYKNWTQ